jgi:heme-degrading monooxygenase HmoA
MQYIAVATPAFSSIEQFDRLTDELGGEPEGLQARYVGSAGDQLCVVSLWESQEDADRFFADRLGPALAKILGPDPAGTPDVRGMEVVRSYTRQPVG